MITCNLKGGLGNQLFQIFATIAYAYTNNDAFFFRNVFILNNGVTKRYTYWHNLLISLKIYLQNMVINMDIVREKSFGYELLPNKTEVLQNVMLDGYFQSYKYFEVYYNKIYNLLRLNDLKKRVTQKYSYNYADFISMHFRFGDYKNLQEIHPIMTYDYYKNSMSTLLNKIKNTRGVIKVLYFCEKDDNEDVDKIIVQLGQHFPSCVFIKVNDQIADWEQMLLMSCCGHNIIANSTFSWWGAYLNTNLDKIVCYPEVWFGPNVRHDTKDLFPETWIKVKCV
jgi:hypothetical protein